MDISDDTGDGSHRFRVEITEVDILIAGSRSENADDSEDRVVPPRVGDRHGRYVVEVPPGRPVSSMETQIRRYDSADAAAVVALSLRAWEPVFESLQAVLGAKLFVRLHPDWRSDQRRAVEGVLTTESTEVWVAHVRERVVGFVATRLHEEQAIGEVHMLAVDPVSQRNGIGTLLTNFALEQIKRAGMTVAMVESGGDPGHAPARGTYEKAGFSLLPVARYFKAL